AELIAAPCPPAAGSDGDADSRPETPAEQPMTKPVRIPVPTAKTAPRRKKFSPVPLVPPRAVPARCRSIGPPRFWRQGTRQARDGLRKRRRLRHESLALAVRAARRGPRDDGLGPPDRDRARRPSDPDRAQGAVQVAARSAGRRGPHPPGPELPAGPRDAGDLARERHRTLDDQRNRQCELPERSAVSALRDPLHRDRRRRSLDRSAYFTTTVPTIPISSWISQMYRYVPAAVNVTL